MESTGSARVYAAPERGLCTACRRDLPLAFATGMVKRHRVNGEPCPGGARPPAGSAAERTEEQILELPNGA